MKDLDFDELDKAVNSLIASTPSGAGSNNAPPSSLPQPLSANSTSIQTAANSLPTVPITATIPSVDRPSTGRFMDVVHPSSDMRTSLVMPERGQSSKPANLVTKPILNIADPIASNTQNNEVVNIVADKDEDDDINQLGNDIAKSLGQVADESPDSPFLSDTKVEKRPLGAFSNDLVTVPNNQPMIPEVAQPPMVQSGVSNVPEPHNLVTPLPAELQSDLLSLESENTTQPEKPIANSFPVIEKPQSSLPILPSPSPVTFPATNPTTTTTTTTTAPVSTSIPQQYKEQPNTGDQNSGAIYDTKAYHKPMIKPTKKKSGWMWVLWVVILLIAGAGAGAAVYFFILPRL